MNLSPPDRSRTFDRDVPVANSSIRPSHGDRHCEIASPDKPSLAVWRRGGDVAENHGGHHATRSTVDQENRLPCATTRPTGTLDLLTHLPKRADYGAWF